MKKTIVIGVIVLVILVLVVVLILGNRGENTIGEKTGSSTRTVLMGKVAVPGTDSEDFPANVAKPLVVASLNEEGTTNLRVFHVEIKNDTFTPDTIIVRRGDLLRLEVSAIDKNYDITQPDYGSYLSIPRGATKKVSFGVSATDKFTLFCKSCGGPELGPVGWLIVTE